MYLELLTVYAIVQPIHTNALHVRLDFELAAFWAWRRTLCAAHGYAFTGNVFNCHRINTHGRLSVV